MYDVKWKNHLDQMRTQTLHIVANAPTNTSNTFDVTNWVRRKTETMFVPVNTYLIQMGFFCSRFDCVLAFEKKKKYFVQDIKFAKRK